IDEQQKDDVDHAGQVQSHLAETASSLSYANTHGEIIPVRLRGARGRFPFRATWSQPDSTLLPGRSGPRAATHGCSLIVGNVALQSLRERRPATGRWIPSPPQR